MAFKVFLTHGTARASRMLMGRDPAYQDRWMLPLARHLERAVGAQVTTHYWSGHLFGPWAASEVCDCAEALGAYLEGFDTTRDVAVMVCKSNGAQLVENALALAKDVWPRESAIEIRLATPLRGSVNHDRLFRRRYWLTSDADTLYRWGRTSFRLLWPRSDAITETLISVRLLGCTHHDFNVDTPLVALSNGAPTSLFQLYCPMVTGDADAWLEAGFQKQGPR